jgi:hypothetical protein
MHIGCRYLQFCAELGRNVDFHAPVRLQAEGVYGGDRHPRHERDAGALGGGGAGGCADYPAAQLVGLDDRWAGAVRTEDGIPGSVPCLSRGSCKVG